MAGGLRYSDVKTELATVVANGVGGANARTMGRVNEAIKAILDEIIPVGGMLTADILSATESGEQVLLLPKEFENAIEVEVLSGAAVNGQTDVTQGWYNILNQFTYVDPAMQEDNPLVDLGLVPDPGDPTILRRKYQYPGLAAGATVRVTGAKRYVPITADGDYLIVQNIRALKMMILSLERYENNDRENAKAYRQDAIEMLQAEVKKHMLDPRNSLKRRAAYEKDLTDYKTGSFAWTRARIALEVQGMLGQGKSEISRILNSAEMRLIERGIWKNCLREVSATIVGGEVLFPRDIETVLAADVCGQPVNIRSIFFEYQQNGPGKISFCGCSQKFIDRGEIYFPQTGFKRRKYFFNGSTSNSIQFTAVAKIRYIEKAGGDELVIKNQEALQLMCQSIMCEKKEDWNGAAAAKQMALDVLESELREFLGGIQHVANVDDTAFGFGGLGNPL